VDYPIQLQMDHTHLYLVFIGVSSISTASSQWLSLLSSFSQAKPLIYPLIQHGFFPYLQLLNASSNSTEQLIFISLQLKHLFH
jgi:hypothetical protein